MKRKIISTGILLMICLAKLHSQSIADSISSKIANSIKDSLSLSASQRDSLYFINQQLHTLKMSARQQYAGNDSLTFQIQRIENNRDSLYRPVLGEEKYLLYREKKAVLISND